MIDNVSNRLASTSASFRKSYLLQPEPYYSLHEDLHDLNNQMTENVAKLHSKESVLKEQLDKLGADITTSASRQASYVDMRASDTPAVTKPNADLRSRGILKKKSQQK